ncbi:hypothetical protein SKAU_G00300640 [Synaphobranchus kaupii]|uniref:Uncharacterized protein n=1 Tax=Synaphobranchus kaupii TaxID=118154 RepID=A0A9Q1EVP1_SYNKA|nr:hypothetical protein SKAU_G00300640 [Synaphobranchus kaupii]
MTNGGEAIVRNGDNEKNDQPRASRVRAVKDETWKVGHFLSPEFQEGKAQAGSERSRHCRVCGTVDGVFRVVAEYHYVNFRVLKMKK